MKGRAGAVAARRTLAPEASGAAPVRSPARCPEAGFSLTEMLVILALMGGFLLIAIPNIVDAHERYLLRTSSTGVAAYLKLARMKAVANNVGHAFHLDPTGLGTGCAGAGDRHALAVYRDDKPLSDTAADNCFLFAKGIDVESVGSAPKDRVRFKPNGMAVDPAPPEPSEKDAGAPNWFLVSGRDGRRCQLVCVNIMGAVYFNPVQEDNNCTSGADYGATSSTPCPPPE